MVATLRRDNRLDVLDRPASLIAFLLAMPVVNLIAPVVGAAFMTQRFQRYGGDAHTRSERINLISKSPIARARISLTRVASRA